MFKGIAKRCPVAGQKGVQKIKVSQKGIKAEQTRALGNVPPPHLKKGWIGNARRQPPGRRQLQCCIFQQQGKNILQQQAQHKHRHGDANVGANHRTDIN